MAVFGVSFWLGFLIGLVLVFLIAWWILNRRTVVFKASFFGSEQEKKRLSDSLSHAQMEMAVLKERAYQASQLNEELASARASLDNARRENNELEKKLVSLSTENEKSLEYFHQRMADLSLVHERMKETFGSISEEALVKNATLINASFKQSMEHFFSISEKDRMVSNENIANVMKPLQESLLLVDKKIQDLEASRQGAYSGLKEQVEGLQKTQVLLQKETQNLAKSLHAPVIRGRWGEMQLRRVVELSGLSSHCDFVEQKSIKENDEVFRPDMIVTLPKNKKIIIDAKAPLDLFVNGEGGEETRGAELAASLRRHLLALKKKSYYSVLADSPEFVVMFLPGEAFLHWALMADPGLLDHAAEHQVIIATPITLIALLKAIAFGFKQEAIANNIEDVRRLSQQLIDRVNKVSSHFEKLGKSLKQATEAYNQTLSSLDSRVLVTARKLADIKSLSENSSEIVHEHLPFLEVMPREASFGEPSEGEIKL